MLQVEFNTLYDRLEAFALYRARLYFKDNSQRQDAVDEAMYKFAYEFSFNSRNVENIEAWGKTVIVNALKDLSKKKREIEPIDIEDKEYDGFHGYRII